MKLTLASVITCPDCGYQKEEIMPGDACLFFYACENCRTLLRPRQGMCCIFCSYGSQKCAHVQLEEWYLSRARTIY